MRALTMISLAAAALASCTRPAAPNNNAAFAQELSGRVAGPAKSCIDSHQGVNLRIIDSQTLAFDDGPTIWVTHLGAPCPGIQTLSTVIVEPKLGGQYCKGDHIRGLEQGAIIPGPTCFIGDWTPYRRQ
ncbi:MAG TPA: hypothetical protein VHE36_12920 [Sphingomicrobium sp.]|nr:hypothetical protein [Sphingomicrobium sp.]